MRKVAEMLAGRAAVVQVNTEENPGLSGRFGVTGIPVLYHLQRGKVVDQISGARPAEAVLEWFESKERG